MSSPHGAPPPAARLGSHEWLGRFCLRLLRELPELRMPHAVQHAVAEYEHASGQRPEDAADELAAFLAPRRAAG